MGTEAEAEMPVLLGEVLATEALTLGAAAAGGETLTLAETDALAETLALMGVGDAAGTSTFTAEEEDTETWAEADEGSDCSGTALGTAADAGPRLTGEGDGSVVREAGGRLTGVKGPG